MLVGLKRISIALGLLAAMSTASQAQGVASGANQATADAVAASLRQSPVLAGYRIEIEARNGIVTLTGAVTNQAQKADALARVQGVPGVRRVADQIAVGDSRVRPVQYQVTRTGLFGHGGGGGGSMYGGTYGGETVMNGAPADSGPMPEGPAGMPGATQASTPSYPNYAWPSYAPYPNFSAVGYPTVYPWQAWPNIGPPYPYPEVPLDWRAVTLRWDDGIWWLDFKKHYTRPFFTPYPFGICAY
jgi:hypothetical protein